MKKISLPAKKRLILLSRFLSQFLEKNDENHDENKSRPSEKSDSRQHLIERKKITSAEISKKTGWSEATIRRDISLLELYNGVSNGYDAEILKDAIDRAFCLGASGSGSHNCCIVGLGSLGQAFLENSVFDGGGFTLAAAFDSSQNRVEIMKSKIPLYQTLDLEKIIRQMKIEFAILTVEDGMAQKMADRLIKYGIKGIVNYTNVVLTVPDGFKMENASPEKSLANLL